MKIVMAALVAVALATPVMAFDVQWGGDFNNRFSYSNQADVSHKTLSGEGYATNYVDGIYDLDNTTNGLILGAGNLPNFAKKSEDSDFLGEIKYRLWLTATDDDKKVNGTLGFEFGGAEFGSNTKADFAGDKNIFELRHAYVDFEVPFDTASRVYVGLQPVGYNKFLWSDNGAGVKYIATRGNLGYSLGWFRDDNSNGGEGLSTKLQNDDVYAFDVTYAIDNGPKLNGFVLYLEEGQDNDAALAAGEYMDQQMWYGLAASGQTGKFFYGATFIKEDGEITYSDAANNAAWGRDRDAWLANLEGSVKLDKTKLTLGWLYTTGDDDANDGDAENFTNIDAYMGGFGSVVVFDSFADDNTMVTAPYILDKGLNMVYLGADYDLNDKASVGASYLWINAAEDLDFGDNTFTKADKEIGHELTARASYKVTKNLTAGIDAGYLIVGDGLDEANKEYWGESADNIFRSDASLRLKF